jgi:hypothetical protein
MGEEPISAVMGEEPISAAVRARKRGRQLMPFFGEVPQSQVDPTDPLPFDTVADGAWSLPIGAGVCAYDRDECTVTIALDTIEDVLWLVENLPHRNRVKVCD